MPTFTGKVLKALWYVVCAMIALPVGAFAGMLVTLVYFADKMSEEFSEEK